MDTNVTENFEMPEGVEIQEEESTVIVTENMVEEVAEEETFVEKFENPVKPVVKRPMFAYWEVCGNRYRLKLKTAGIQQLENKYKRNLMSFLDSMPSLSIMLEVVHMAMTPWHKGVQLKHIQALYDKYIDEGNDQMTFWRDVFIEVYKASGFFTQEMLESMADTSN